MHRLPLLFFPTLCPASYRPAAPAAGAQDPVPAPGPLTQALRGGRSWLKLRYRLENVDEEPLPEEAWASTLRTVLGHESAPWHGTSVLLEFEDVSVLGEDHYDDTLNGETERPVVADPEATEINQVFVRHAGPGATEWRLGRQVITHDAMRFIGDVSWRQNQQTFDAVTVDWKGIEHLAVTASWVENVNRSLGDDSPAGDERMGSLLFNAAHELPAQGRLSAYAYRLDYDDLATSSRTTLGLRLTGQHTVGGLLLQGSLEGAEQHDTAENPLALDESYRLIELGAKYGDTGLKLASETLGGSGQPGESFQTPLATLHAYNGWADKFLTTPDAGLVDLHVCATHTVDAVELTLAWHTFEADAGSDDYGHELDAALLWHASEALLLGLKLADYEAEDFATDTTKLWLWLAFSP